MKSLKFILALIFLFVVPNIYGGQAKMALDQKDGGFAFKIFKELKKEDPNKNVFISPSSISLALSMAYNGANGKTKDEIGKTLEVLGLTMEELNEQNLAFLNLFTDIDPKVEISISNSMWPEKKFKIKKAFVDEMMKFYKAKVETLDFNKPESAKIINKWVSDSTKGKIDSIVESPIDPAVVLFIINAIYFKGRWSVKFDKSLTKDNPFYIGSSIDGEITRRIKKVIPMMSQEREDFRYLDGEGFQAVKLTYGKSKRVSMYIFLPDNLTQFVNNLSLDKWNGWMKLFSKMKGTLELPRFRIEYDKILNEVLVKLGMKTAFEPTADFNGIFVRDEKTQNVFISEVKHKSYVDVNEEGTEAAAATMMDFRLSADGPRTFLMTVDHPFFFVIRDDKTGSNLFIGAIEDPTAVK